MLGRPLHSLIHHHHDVIAWGSERFYLLVFENEDLKVCSKSVLAQELWSYGARTGKGYRKAGGKNQGLYHREAVLSVWLPWRSRAAALCPYPAEAEGYVLEYSLYRVLCVIAVGEGLFVKQE